MSYESNRRNSPLPPMLPAVRAGTSTPRCPSRRPLPPPACTTTVQNAPTGRPPSIHPLSLQILCVYPVHPFLYPRSMFCAVLREEKTKMLAAWGYGHPARTPRTGGPVARTTSCSTSRRPPSPRPGTPSSAAGSPVSTTSPGTPSASSPARPAPLPCPCARRFFHCHCRCRRM